MKKYTVLQVADLLETNPETVRRWIRSGQLSAEQSSRKGGNIISEQSLTSFLNRTPKYAARATENGMMVQQPMQITVTDRVPEPNRMRMYGAASPKRNNMILRSVAKPLEPKPELVGAPRMEIRPMTGMSPEPRMAEVAAVLEDQQRKILELERMLKSMESQLGSKRAKRK